MNFLDEWVRVQPDADAILALGAQANEQSHLRPRIFDFDDNNAPSPEVAREFANLYDLNPSPLVINLLTPGSNERRHEVARQLVLGARLAAGESLELLIDEGYIVEARSK